MANNLKKSLAILKQELGLQVITVSMVTGAVLLSLLVTKLFYPVENELAGMFIGFYTVLIGLVLPWQMNTKGQLEIGYCRYHLSLPVASWQLYLIPLIFRLLLIFIFIGTELVVYKICYHEMSGRVYITLDNILTFTKISLLLYLTLQAYGWSKASFKNLFTLVGTLFVALAFIKIRIIYATIDNPYFIILSLDLIVLAMVGVRNLRFGKIYRLPSWYSCLTLFRSKKIRKVKSFKNIFAAQFYHEWRRTWFYMPMLTMGTIIFCLLIKFRNHSTGFNLLSLVIFYLAIMLIVPLCGIVLLKNRGFKSSFINNLPMPTKYLSQVRFRCFALSFALSLLMLLVAGLIILAYNNNLLNQLYTANFELMHSPLLLIWFAVAVIFYSFVLAFFIAGAYLNNRLISIIMILALFGYYLSNAYEMYRIRDFGFHPDGLPWYIPLATVMMAMIAVKCLLLYLNKAPWFIKIIYTIAIPVISFFWINLANRQPVLMLLPLLLIFSFPLMAYQQQTVQKRYDVRAAKINIPWRLIIFVSLVFSLFTIYTKVLNLRLSNKLQNTIELCKTINDIPKQQKTKVKMGAFIAKELPDKTKNLKLFSEYYRIKCGETVDINNISIGSRDYNIFNAFVHNIIDDAIKQGHYAKALKYSIFYYKLNLMNNRFHGLNLTYNLGGIFRFYSPTAVELVQLSRLLRTAEAKNILFIQREIDEELLAWGTGDVPIDKYQYGDTSSNRDNSMNVRSYNFVEFALAPLDISRKINYANDTLIRIKALKFLQGKPGENILSVKVYLNYISYYSYLLSRQQQLQYRKIYVAILQYRHKYGASPKRLELLVPEFLTKKDLYVIYNSYGWYSVKGNSAPQALILLPILMKDMNQYIHDWGYR